MTTTLHIDAPVKQAAQKVAADLGLSFNSLINALLRKAIREGGADLRTKGLTVNGLTPEFEKSILDARKEEGMEFGSVEEMINFVRNENRVQKKLSKGRTEVK